MKERISIRYRFNSKLKSNGKVLKIKGDYCNLNSPHLKSGLGISIESIQLF